MATSTYASLLGIEVRDATAGFRLFRRQTLEKIDLAKVKSTGYVFQTDMVSRTLNAGLVVREVPIEFVERVRGDSKMSGAVATESLKRITVWGLRERRDQIRRAWRGRRELTMARDAGERAWLLFIAFIVVPIVEIYVLIQVGQVIGPWWTILLLIADSILGSWLIKREGGRAWRALQLP